MIKGSNQPTIYALMIDTREFSYRRFEPDNTIHHQHNFKSYNGKSITIWNCTRLYRKITQIVVTSQKIQNLRRDVFFCYKFNKN